LTRINFSALQRAENSSMIMMLMVVMVVRDFSALQRAENSSIVAPNVFTCQMLLRNFSALQRAENSSIAAKQSAYCRTVGFQCSSASRKFLNQQRVHPPVPDVNQFQCSSASRKFLNPSRFWSASRGTTISVLFSEPKIPQCNGAMVGQL